MHRDDNWSETLNWYQQSCVRFRIYETNDIERHAKKEKCREIVWFGPIFRMKSMVQPIIFENTGPIIMVEGRTISSFILELRPNICENLQ